MSYKIKAEPNLKLLRASFLEARMRAALHLCLCTSFITLLLIPFTPSVAVEQPSAQDSHNSLAMHIVSDAIKLQPSKFKVLYGFYEQPFLEGLNNYKEVAKIVPFDDILQADDLKQAIDELASIYIENVRAAMDGQKLGTFFYNLGLWSRAIIELHNPLNTSSADDMEQYYAPLYNRFAISMQPKFMVGFSGFDTDLSFPAGVSTILGNSIHPISRMYPMLGKAFYVDGKIVSPESFDERSIPFGIASVSYNKAVNCIAQIIFLFWRQMGGDTSDAVFR